MSHWGTTRCIPREPEEPRDGKHDAIPEREQLGCIGMRLDCSHSLRGKVGPPGVAAHEVEAGIWQRVVPLGRHALGWWFRLVGPGERGEPVLWPDGHAGRRRETPQARGYQAVLGRFELERVVDGPRAGQKMASVPCDRQ